MIFLPRNLKFFVLGDVDFKMSPFYYDVSSKSVVIII